MKFNFHHIFILFKANERKTKKDQKPVEIPEFDPSTVHTLPDSLQQLKI